MRNVFERSPNRSNTNNVANCNASGNLNNNAAYNGNYVAPDCARKTGKDRDRSAPSGGSSGSAT